MAPVSSAAGFRRESFRGEGDRLMKLFRRIRAFGFEDDADAEDDDDDDDVFNLIILFLNKKFV